MKKQKNQPLPETILAIDPTVRGFGYVVFGGNHKPIDWGKVNIRINKNKRCRTKIKKLIEKFNPDCVVIEKTENSLRRDRVRALIADVIKDTKQFDIPVHQYSREKVLDVFACFGVRAKHSIAAQIAEWFPCFESSLPPRQRRFYEPEDERYGIFDAAALALVHVYLTD